MKTKRYNVFLRPSITLFLSSSVPIKITIWLNSSYALADKILLLLFFSRLHFHFPSLTSGTQVNYHVPFLAAAAEAHYWWTNNTLGKAQRGTSSCDHKPNQVQKRTRSS
uniref:Uncharacterized protein n=1 Tax=Trypanosoma brucei brucei (strain 927/4 GUTat10.1) TaxID=185431 RepID=Q4FKT6_TRYB2|nr:hypothetical protein Tb09.v4.0066 [Trypanosoma brucei brucei TREU927]